MATAVVPISATAKRSIMVDADGVPMLDAERMAKTFVPDCHCRCCDVTFPDSITLTLEDGTYVLFNVARTGKRRNIAMAICA